MSSGLACVVDLAVAKDGCIFCQSLASSGMTVDCWLEVEFTVAAMTIDVIGIHEKFPIFCLFGEKHSFASLFVFALLV